MKIRNAAVALATAVALTSTGLASADVIKPPSRFAEVNHIHACRHEDGSGQLLCVWDARHRGNGEGHSFLLVRSRKNQQHANYVRINHSRAHRLTHNN